MGGGYHHQPQVRGLSWVWPGCITGSADSESRLSGFVPQVSPSLLVRGSCSLSSLKSGTQPPTLEISGSCSEI